MAVILSTEVQEWEWSTNRVIQEYAYELATCTDFLINEYGEYVEGRPYHDQAKELMYRIPVYRPHWQLAMII